MARERKVYVIEFKAGNGRKWYEVDCFLLISEAKRELVAFREMVPNDHVRLVEYHPANIV